MNLFENAVNLLEYLFQGYVAYIYFVTFFKRKYNAAVTAFFFLLSGVAAFFIFQLNLGIVNIVSCILMYFLLDFFLLQGKIGPKIFHPFVLIGMQLATEIIVIPIVNLVFSDNFAKTNSTIPLLFGSALSKLFLFMFCIIVKKIAVKEDRNTRSLWLLVLPLSTSLTIIDVFYMSAKIEMSGTLNLIMLFCSLLLMAANIVVFVIYELSIKTEKELARVTLAEQKTQLDYDYYSLLKESYDDSRIIVHDTKHHLSVIRAFADDDKSDEIEKYIDSIIGQDYFKSAAFITGNKIFDIILHQKENMCKQENISFSFRHNNTNLDFIDDLDLCCILSNLIDNAIEAAKNSEKKTVVLDTYKSENSSFIFLEVRNSCDVKPKKSATGFVSSKQGKYHGIGLYSVEKTVKKYGGELNHDYDENEHIFYTTIMLPEK